MKVTLHHISGELHITGDLAPLAIGGTLLAILQNDKLMTDLDDAGEAKRDDLIGELESFVADFAEHEFDGTNTIESVKACLQQFVDRLYTELGWGSGPEPTPSTTIEWHD